MTGFNELINRSDASRLHSLDFDFTLALLESRNCIGWHWFKYLDNDPDDLTTDLSNRDSNKGIVNLRYEP